jgi:hypothetical protein
MKRLEFFSKRHREDLFATPDLWGHHRQKRARGPLPYYLPSVVAFADLGNADVAGRLLSARSGAPNAGGGTRGQASEPPFGACPARVDC